MPSIHVRFAYKHTPNLVPEFEDANRTSLLFHASADLGHAYAVRQSNSPGKNTVELELNYDQSGIEPDSGLSVRAFSCSKNGDGVPVLLQAGFCFIPIGKMLSSTEDVHIQSLHLTVPNAANYRTGTVPSKGTIELVFEKVVFPNGRNPIREVNSTHFVPENRKPIAQELFNFMELVSMPYTELAPSNPKCIGLRMPFMISGHVEAPGEVFAVPRAQPSSESWWKTSIIAAVRRAYPEIASNEEAERHVLSNQATTGMIMNILMIQHSAIVANGTAYVSDGIYEKSGDEMPMMSSGKMKLRAFGDFVPVTAAPPSGPRGVNIATMSASRGSKFTSMEDFSIGLLRMMKAPEWGCRAAADCEDGGAEISVLAHSFGTATFKDPMLVKMQNVRKMYLICQVLMYVNGAEIRDGEGKFEQGGHMASAYVLQEYVAKLQARITLGNQSAFTGMAGRLDSGYNPPVIFGEGTGTMWPLPDDTMASKLGKACNYMNLRGAVGLEGSRFMMPHSRTQPNRFYNEIVSLVPLEFADQYASIEQLMVTVGSSSRPALGGNYMDFINGTGNLGLYPTAPMNEQQLRIVKNIAKHFPPIPAYKDSVTATESHPLLEGLVFKVQSMRRTCTTESPLLHQQFFCSNEVTQQAVNSMYDRVKNLDRVYQVSYRLEKFGETVSSYAVVFHINP